MRIAVIGAGVVGVTTAYELCADGHEVTVFERHSSVAAEASFAPAGLMAAGLLAGWRAPVGAALRNWRRGDDVMRWQGLPSLSSWRWASQWRRSTTGADAAQGVDDLARLARFSRMRTLALNAALQLEYEQGTGALALLSTPRELERAKPVLAALAGNGIAGSVVDADTARAIEPALSASVPLHAAIHLPDDPLGNCRQFAHLLKNEAQQRGVRFEFRRVVEALNAGPRPAVRHRAVDPDQATRLADSGFDESSDANDEEHEAFDAVVLCVGAHAASLLQPLGVRLPLAAVHGYSVTAPLRDHEHALATPRVAVVDVSRNVTISRVGRRVRVAGGAELGPDARRYREPGLRPLYAAAAQWFPGALRSGQAQRWKGARGCMADGLPAIGATSAPGIWLNVGHGDHGWALACGSARLLADTLRGAQAPLALNLMAPARLSQRLR